MIKIALLCTNPSPALRPTMSAVVSMLEGNSTVVSMLKGNLLVQDLATDPNMLSNEWVLEASRKQHNDRMDLSSASETHSLIQSAESHD
ncbi:hypothetical protein Ancab_034029, partial [Ancistrocladus abbreviatus]